MECVHSTDGVTADLCTEVPSSEAVVFFSVHLPYLVNHELVVLDLVAHILGVPVYAGVVKTEIEFHTVLLSETAEHIDEVDRRHIAALLQKVW